MTCLDSGQRLLAYLHPQFEDEDDRKKTFEYWPCLPQTEEQLVEAGFYFTGRYEILQCGDVEKLIRKCANLAEEPIYFVNIDAMYDIIKRAHISTGHGGSDLSQVSTEGPVHTVNPGKPHLDMLSISAALECNYSIEQIREAVLRFFMLSRGQYPNTAILLGLLQATDRNFNMLQQQRQRTHIKDTELQKEKETSRTAECRLVREQQTHRALVEGQAAVIQMHRQQLENKQQTEENQKEMIRRLAGELQKVGRDLREIPDDDSEEVTTPPVDTRCKVCLSEDVNVLFRPCRHICCGSQCAPRFIGQTCPICRGVVLKWELVFLS